MKILVTGGAGFIGANLCRYLLRQDISVRVLDSMELGGDRIAGLDLEVLEGDVRTPEIVARALQGCDGVVHLAAQSGVAPSLADPMRDCDINVIGLLTVLEACRARLSESADPLRLVMASSNAAIGKQPPPVDETVAPRPLSPYGAAKLAGEGYCLAYHGSFGLGTVVLRFGNAYGPHSRHKQSVVASFMRRILAGEVIVVDGNGDQTRDFVHTDDLCVAIHKALVRPLGGEIFQIASGTETSIRGLIEVLEKVTGRTLSKYHGPPRRGDMPRNFSRIDKAEKLLDWRPRVVLEDGLARLWRWNQEYPG